MTVISLRRFPLSANHRYFPFSDRSHRRRALDAILQHSDRILKKNQKNQKKTKN